MNKIQCVKCNFYVVIDWTIRVWYSLKELIIYICKLSNGLSLWIQKGAIMKYSKPIVETKPKEAGQISPRGTCAIYACSGKYDCDGANNFKCTILYF